jgi:hypothetical protein
MFFIGGFGLVGLRCSTFQAKNREIYLILINKFMEVMGRIQNECKIFFKFFSTVRIYIYNPCPPEVHSNATVLAQKDANKTAAEIRVGRNDETTVARIWPNLRSGATVLVKAWRYDQPIRDRKINSCSLRKPGAQTGVQLTPRAIVGQFLESNLK